MTSQTFASHESPVIADYTPDYLVVGAEVVSLGDDDIVKTVTYTADEQKLTVTFIDDTTGETLKMVIKSGPSSADTGYNTASDIKNYTDAHYELVSDSTNGANLVFDHDANIEQHYAVHLKHHTNHRTDTKSVHRTIHYTYADGTPAGDDVVQTASFTRNGQYDQVTHETAWGDWTENQNLGQVVSPKIDGYTASQDVVAEMAVTPTSEDSEITVVYGKAPDKSRKPNQPAQPEKPGQIDYQGQPQEIPSASAETRNKLPQTGDDNDSALATGFIGLTSLLAMLGLGKKRKQD